MQSEKDQPSASRILDNLVKRDFVRRVPHPTDRRTNLIFLTEKAKVMKDRLEALALKTIEEASTEIDPKEMEIVLRVLDKIRENLK